jgi:hypothetical protein
MRSSTVTVTNVHEPEPDKAQVKPISASSAKSPHGRVVALSFGAVTIVAIAMCFVLDKGLKPAIFHTVTGYIPLAGIVAISTALERFLEPISNMIQQLSPPGTSQERADATEAAKKATEAMNKSADATQTANINPSEQKNLSQVAANALLTAHANAKGLTATQAVGIATAAAVDPQLSESQVAPMVQTAADKLAQVRADKTVVFWALASICGLAISGSFGFLLLQAISSQHVNQCLDLIVTGLVIGAGTKPLHDLITGIQSK